MVLIIVIEIKSDTDLDLRKEKISINLLASHFNPFLFCSAAAVAVVQVSALHAYHNSHLLKLHSTFYFIIITTTKQYTKANGYIIIIILNKVESSANKIKIFFCKSGVKLVELFCC